ncbi:MAG: hypothetical protein K2X93_05620 [Candidatus Obscuribacterales bacterium]|nr:hypothetical protein [Candidatus Obscuribacterales bacterium]
MGGAGGRGLALDGVGARRSRAFVERRVSEGSLIFFGSEHYKPAAYRMPPSKLSTKEIKQITDFLFTLAPK